MKKHHFIYMVLALIMCMGLNACKDEQSSVAGGLAIDAFTPSIVMPGTEVTITGKGFQQVSEIVFPGNVSVTDFEVVDDNIIKVKTPATMEDEDGHLIVKSSDATAESRQTMHKASPQFDSYVFSDKEGAKTGGLLTILGKDLLYAEELELTLGDKTVKIPAILFNRKSNDAIKVTLPEDAPIGENIVTKLVFSNASTVDLQPLAIAKGVFGGHWEEKEVVVYNGDKINVGGWSASIQIAPDAFPELKEGDIIRVYIEDAKSDAQGSLKDSEKWAALGEGLEYFDLTAEEKEAGYYVRTLNAAMIERLKKFNLIVAGKNYVITKVSIFTSVWVSDKDDLRDPVSPNAILLNNFEEREGHNSTWDGSWTAGVELEFLKESNGNIYLRLKTPVSGEFWLINCNHIDLGTVANIENYVVKFDLLIEEGVVGASKAKMQYILGDNWLWVGEGFFPETTNGKWMTVTKAITDIKSEWVGDLVLGKKTNGMYGGDIPAGICIDNFRLEPKK